MFAGATPAIDKLDPAPAIIGNPGPAPSLSNIHWYDKLVPVAVVLNAIFDPAQALIETG